MFRLLFAVMQCKLGNEDDSLVYNVLSLFSALVSVQV